MGRWGSIRATTGARDGVSVVLVDIDDTGYGGGGGGGGGKKN